MPWINPRLRHGEVRKVVTGIPGKTGIVYTLDRETGEFLWATPTVTQNVISDIDGATGAVTENSEVVFTGDGQTVLACPTLVGGKDWEAGAYSPQTGLMYFPLRKACARMMATAGGDSVATSLYALVVRSELAPGTDQLGTVQAISPETGELMWTYEQRAATTSLVATAGGLVFGGDLNGRFRALDAETGDVLWEVNLGSPITGFPIRVRRRRPAVRRGQHRQLAHPGVLRAPDARAAPEHGQQPVRLRLAGLERPARGRSRSLGPAATWRSRQAAPGPGQANGAPHGREKAARPESSTDSSAPRTGGVSASDRPRRPRRYDPAMLERVPA